MGTWVASVLATVLGWPKSSFWFFCNILRKNPNILWKIQTNFLANPITSIATNIGLHVSFRISVFIFSGYIPRNGIAMVVLFLIFKGTSILFSVVAAPIYIPTNIVGGFPFLYTLSSIYYL